MMTRSVPLDSCPAFQKKDKSVPGPNRGSIPIPASPNTTTVIATETTAPTPSRSSNHSVTETTKMVSSLEKHGGDMAL